MISGRDGSATGWFRLGRKAARRGATPAPGGRSRTQPEAVESLTAADRDAVQHVLDVLRAGEVLMSPPDPELLHHGVADQGLPVRVDEVLAAMWEAYDDDRLAGFAQNLVHHASQVEQHATTLERQVSDLARLTAGAVTVVLDRIEQAPAGAALRNRLWLRLDGSPHLVDYLGAPKQLSTVVHVEIARALRAAGTPRRLAWLWSDSGPWITGLTTDVARLNADLGLDPDDPDCTEWWAWVDEEAPLAAGDRSTG